MTSEGQKMVAMKMPKGFAGITLAGLVLGVAVGCMLNRFAPPDLRAGLAVPLGIVATIFLNLVKMVIAPLIFATLTGGIAGLGDSNAVARITIKAMFWFLAASIISLFIGAAMAMLLRPGALATIPMLTAPSAGIDTDHAITLEGVVVGAFPTSVINALATNNVLQIVVFSLFAGFALAQLGEAGALLRRAVGQLASLMLVITQKVMLAAPVAIFCAVAETLAVQGLDILASLAWLVAGYYVALLILILLFALIGYLLEGRRAISLVRAIREPALIAFSTSSSEAAYPRLLAALEGFGFKRDLVSLVLPLGYSFNLDASITYCAFAAMFLLDLHGLHLDKWHFLLLMFMLMLASKGIAAVPRGSLLALAAVLPQFGVPASSLGLLLAVDHLMNMGRSGVNVIGNSLAVLAVARWEHVHGEDDGSVHRLSAAAAVAGGARHDPPYGNRSRRPGR